MVNIHWISGVAWQACPRLRKCFLNSMFCWSCCRMSVPSTSRFSHATYTSYQHATYTSYNTQQTPHINTQQTPHINTQHTLHISTQHTPHISTQHTPHINTQHTTQSSVEDYIWWWCDLNEWWCDMSTFDRYQHGTNSSTTRYKSGRRQTKQH